LNTQFTSIVYQLFTKITSAEFLVTKWAIWRVFRYWTHTSESSNHVLDSTLVDFKPIDEERIKDRVLNIVSRM
jgi:hypothetical protein